VNSFKDNKELLKDAQELLQQYKEKLLLSDDPREIKKCQAQIQRYSNEVSTLETEIWSLINNELSKLKEDREYKILRPLLAQVKLISDYRRYEPEVIQSLLFAIQQLRQMTGEQGNPCEVIKETIAGKRQIDLICSTEIHDQHSQFHELLVNLLKNNLGVIEENYLRQTLLSRYDGAEPRCAIALVLDTSASMSGEYSHGLLEGIRTFQQELADDITASRSIEIAMVTLGGSAKVTQPFVTAGEFSPRELQLQGEAEMGRGVEIALQITAHRRKIYEKQNVQHYQPWILLISGSDSQDNWQNAAQQVAQAISAQQLNCIAIGTPGANLNVLQQITTSAFSLPDLEFDSLFHWLANLMKKISRKDVLDRLASAVDTVTSSLPPEKASIVQQCAEQLIVEAAKPKTYRQDYTPKAAELLRNMRELGEEGKTVTKTVSELTKKIGLT